MVLPVATAGEARSIAGHLTSISAPAWSPDGRSIAYTVNVDPDNPDEKPRPKDAPAPVRVTSRLDYKLDGKGYLGNVRAQVFVADVESGSRRALTSEAYDHSQSAWSPDGRTIAITVGGPNVYDSMLALVDVASGSVRRLTGEGGNVSTFAWSPDGDRILFAGDTDHTWQSDFFVYDASDGSISRLTEDLPIQPTSGREFTRPEWLDGETVIICGVRAGGSGMYTFNVNTAELNTITTWQATLYGFSGDISHQHFAAVRNDQHRNGDLVIYDRASHELTTILSPNEASLAVHAAPTAERFTVERAGLEIEAWILFPPGFDKSRHYPVILDIHGGPNGHYGWDYVVTQQILASNGYIVVLSNPRGSGSYGRDFTMRVLTDWGGEDYLDLMLVLDTVLERPYADRSRTGVYGYSYGGYMTSWIIGQTNRFQAAVCGAPCFDLESMYGTSDIGFSFGSRQWGGKPHQIQEWLQAHSPSEYAYRATTPTLIVHGEADDRCPIGQGEQMFVMLREAGCEVEFARYPGGSHGMTRLGSPEHREDYYRRVLAWFDDHLN